MHLLINVLKSILFVFSGLFVLAFSLWMAGPGLSEAEVHVIRWQYLLPLLFWCVGMILHFQKKYRILGAVLMVIPTLFYLLLAVGVL